MNPVRASHSIIDQYTAKLTALAAKKGGKVTCKAGCFHCCREPLMAEIEEARLLVSNLTDPVERAEVTAKTQLWWDAFFGGGYSADVSPLEDRYVESGMLWKYRAAMIWCPFLKDGLCSQYADRPNGCRLHIAGGSARKCEDDKKRPEQRFLSSDKDGEVMTMALAAQCENAQQSFFMFDHLGVWLGQLLLGKTERSAAAQDLIINQKNPQSWTPHLPPMNPSLFGASTSTPGSTPEFMLSARGKSYAIWNQLPPPPHQPPQR